MPKGISSQFHVVLSPECCPPILPLVNYAKNHCVRYVCAYEYGANGHKHIDAFMEFKDEKRQDHVRRAILNLYKSIPESQLINCKFMINHRDPNPLYGFGYSLKENEEIYTNLDIDTQIESLEYYYKHKDRVKELCDFYKSKKSLTIKDLTNGLVDYVTAALDGQPYTLGHSYLIHEYLTVVSKRLDYQVYAKLKMDTLSEWLVHKMGGISLDNASPIPIVFKIPNESLPDLLQ